MAYVSHGIDVLKLASSELASVRLSTSLDGLTDSKDDSTKHCSGPLTKSYMVFAALRKLALACSVASSHLGNAGSASGSNASLSEPFVLRKALMALADSRQDSASFSRSEESVAMVKSYEMDD